MTRDHAVFLRGISNVPMEPSRAALVGLGLKDVDSFGATGNLVFSAPGSDVALLEQRICEAVGAEAFVRTRLELSAIVANDPYSGREGASLFLARRPVDETSTVFRGSRIRDDSGVSAMTRLGAWIVPVGYLTLAFGIARMERWRTPGQGVD